MCGIFCIKSFNGQKLNFPTCQNILAKQSYRGPDSTKFYIDGENIFLGHNRLRIVDLNSNADQPFFSKDRRYVILFNGEIYNHKELRKKIGLSFLTESDTETILKGYEKFGAKIFEMLDGMFAVVIYDTHKDTFVIARDYFGIKPLYYYHDKHYLILSSDIASINEIVQTEIDTDSILEWKVFRSPLPGKTFFKNIHSIMPGTMKVFHKNTKPKTKYFWNLEPSNLAFSEVDIIDLLSESISNHLMTDTVPVTLLSGGIDSSIVTIFSGIKEAYSVGFKDLNEFTIAEETSKLLGIDLKKVTINQDEYSSLFEKLIRLKKAPLLVPNEILIHKVSIAMPNSTKVFLTGEGADELFFGYDQIFSDVNQGVIGTLDQFIERYRYSETKVTDRFYNYLTKMKENKSMMEFLEDFFIFFHLGVLLDRMDFSSMSASKEARVPFVTKKLFNYMYRRPYSVRGSLNAPKKILRKELLERGFEHITRQKKIGFTTFNPNLSRLEGYQTFQKQCEGLL